VGELLRALGWRNALKEAYPNRRWWFSTTTITGQSLARERLQFADAVFYFPLDWTFCVRSRVAGSAAGHRDVWKRKDLANFLREAKRQDVPVLFVSGRISDRSFCGTNAILASWFFSFGRFAKRAWKCERFT